MQKPILYHLVILLQRLANTDNIIEKCRLLRELSVYVFEGEKLKDTVSKLTRAELVLEALIPKLYYEKEEVYNANKQMIDDTIMKQYIDAVARVMDIESQILALINELEAVNITIEE